MMVSASEMEQPADVDQAMAAERPRLVRYCASLTGDPSVAEDLAQETMFEAWRLWSRLQDRHALTAWLLAIARNVCLRWQRRQNREAIALRRHLDAAQLAPQREEEVDALLIDLERQELAILLDRALALLPVETRVALTQHYIEAAPHAAIAARLGVSAGAVAIRIHRGKLAFRQLLAGELRYEAETFGLAPLLEPQSTWRATRIWCPECGQHRLEGHLDPVQGDFAVRCPRCSPEPGLEISNVVAHAGLFEGIHGFKAAYTRVLNWCYRYYRSVLSQQHTGLATCWVCGRSVPLRLRFPSDDPVLHPSLHGQPGVYIRCPCREGQPQHCVTPMRSLTLHLPEVQQFWRTHPRMRALPAHAVNLGGSTGIVMGFESIDSSARIEVIALRDTYEVLHICGTQ